MNKLLIATAAVAFATAGAASAADLPTKAPPMVAAAPALSWTGCYIDAGVGYGMWNQNESEFFGGVNTGTYTTGGKGWLGRFGGGCDYQFNSSFVFGIFGDYDVSDLKGDVQGANFTATGGGAIYESNPLQRSFRDMAVINTHIAAQLDRGAEAYGRVHLTSQPNPTMLLLQ